MYYSKIILFLLIFFVVDFFIRTLIPLLGKIFIDIPNERSSHKYPKLKSGGIFFIIPVLIYILIEINLQINNQLSYILFLCSLLGFIGFIDDLLDLSSKLRYIFQIIICSLIINNTYNEFLLEEKYFYFFCLIIFGTGIINLLNFMDGLDGLLIGSLFPLLIYSQLNGIDPKIFILIASMLAFLKWNWEPSKIFMGDSGSNFLGALIFYLLISNNHMYIDYKSFFIIFPLMFDSTLCIVYRFINKENIFVAHNKHIYQRLHQAGINHSKISSIYISFCCINFLITLNFKSVFFIIAIISEIIILLFLDKNFAKKFS